MILKEQTMLTKDFDKLNIGSKSANYIIKKKK